MENVSHLKICPFCNCENQTEEKSHKTLSHSFQSLLYAEPVPLDFVFCKTIRILAHIHASGPSYPSLPSFLTHSSLFSIHDACERGREREGGEASRRPRPHRRCASERAHKKFHHFNYFPCLPPFPFPAELILIIAVTLVMCLSSMYVLP